MASIERIGRKHSIAYIRLLFGTAVMVGFLLLLSSAKDIRPYSQWILLLVAVVLLRTIGRWLQLHSVAWVVTAEAVDLKGGWLPWTKYQYHLPIDTIFEAYSGIGFWA